MDTNKSIYTKGEIKEILSVLEKFYSDPWVQLLEVDFISLNKILLNSSTGNLAINDLIKKLGSSGDTHDLIVRVVDNLNKAGLNIDYNTGAHKLFGYDWMSFFSLHNDPAFYKAVEFVLKNGESSQYIAEKLEKKYHIPFYKLDACLVLLGILSHKHGRVSIASADDLRKYLKMRFNVIVN
jgi:hypothetical protein